MSTCSHDLLVRNQPYCLRRGVVLTCVTEVGVSQAPSLYEDALYLCVFLANCAVGCLFERVIMKSDQLKLQIVFSYHNVGIVLTVMSELNLLIHISSNKHPVAKLLYSLMCLYKALLSAVL